MKFSLPAAPFAFAWRSVWPAAATEPVSFPLYRSVMIERYDDPDVTILWATDGYMMLRALVPAVLDPDEPWRPDDSVWNDLMGVAPAERVIAHDAEKLVLVLAKTAAKIAKDDENLQVTVTIGRHTPLGSQPALSSDLEPRQAIIETEGLRVECLAVEANAPDWRRLLPTIDLGARVKRMSFSAARLKRLTAVPGAVDVRFSYTSTTGATTIEYTTAGGGLLPVRGLVMPTRTDSDDGRTEDVEPPPSPELARGVEEYLSDYRTEHDDDPPQPSASEDGEQLSIDDDDRPRHLRAVPDPDELDELPDDDDPDSEE